VPEVARTLATRRGHHEHRVAVVGGAASELSSGLAAFARGVPRPSVSYAQAGAPPKLVFVYGGQGPQWWAMGRQLYASEPVFRAKLDECHEAMRAAGGFSLLDELLADEARSRMADTAVGQPSIFALQVSLAALWASWGITPDAVVGHSVGEVAAVHAAGILDLAAAARLVFHRARLMDQTTGAGEMWAVDLAASEVARFAPGVSISCINGPASTVIAGTHEELHRARQSLEAVTEQLTNLGVPYAFHSSQMDRITPELASAIAGLAPKATKLPFYSTVTGAKLEGTALDAAYWVKNVRETVRFYSAISALAEGGFEAFVEVGAHPALTRHVETTVGEKARVAWSLRREKDEGRELATNLARLHVAGVHVDWRGLYRGRVRPVAIPGYAWDHKRYWAIDDETPAIARTTMATNPADWVSPLVGFVRPSALHDDAVFESTISAHDPRFVRDHAMHGLVILPAAGFLELARGAAASALGVAVPHLTDVTIREPLVFAGDEPRTLQTIVGRDGAVRVFSRARDQWTLHVSLHATVSEGVPDAATLVEAAARATEALDVAGRYAEAAAHGVGLGPSFQVLSMLHRGDDVATARLVLPRASTMRAPTASTPRCSTACCRPRSARSRRATCAGGSCCPSPSPRRGSIAPAPASTTHASC
jgi:acyl transferase domain-containing protein